MAATTLTPATARAAGMPQRGVAGEAERGAEPGQSQHQDEDGEGEVGLRVRPEDVADVQQRDEDERDDREDAGELHGGLLTVKVRVGAMPPVAMT